MLALVEQDCPSASLKHAVALARVLDAPIHVLRVLPRPSLLPALFSPRALGVAARMVQRTRSAHQATLAWLRASLGPDDVIEQVSIAHGDFVAQTAICATNIGAQLIVVPSGEARLGKTAKSLACAALLPVLVARKSTGAPAIVAATDLQSAGYPVLARAAELGRQLQKSLVAVHNVEPQPLSSMDVIWTTRPVGPDLALDLCSAQLARAVERFSIEMKSVVLNEISSADAILGQAQARGADLVVIGTRRHSWFEVWANVSVATQVVNRALQSVLVLPLDEAAPLA